MTGISWLRAADRIGQQMLGFEDAFGPMVNVPLLSEADLIEAAQAHVASHIGTPPPPFSIGGFRFPDGSLDDCSNEPTPPPSAA